MDRLATLETCAGIEVGALSTGVKFRVAFRAGALAADQVGSLCPA